MRLSTSSSRRSWAAALATLAVGAVAIELYCRNSPDFDQLAQLRILRLIEEDTTNAVIGDSQVGEDRYLPSFSYFGFGGLQASELYRLVKFSYTMKRPGKVIVELAPQWFGEYHRKREEMFTADALPPDYVRLASLSPYFYKSIKAHLLKNINPVAPASAQDLAEPSDSMVSQYARDWGEQRQREGESFSWMTFDPEKRRILTLSRAYGQNPVQGFEKGAAAQDFAATIIFLLERGASLCLVEPPITEEYREIRKKLPNSNYPAFYEYADQLVTRYKVRWIRDVLPLVDRDFGNQDHLLAEAHQRYWPTVYEACFDEPPVDSKASAG